MISSGPRSLFFVSTLASVQGFRFARRRLEERLAGGGDRAVLVQLVRLVLVDRVREGVAELLVGERDGAVVVRRVVQHGRARAQRRERQRQHAPEGRRARSRRRRRRARGRRGSRVSRPPNEWPITAGLRSSLRMTLSKWSATWPIDLRAKTSGFSFASATVSGSSGQPGVRAAKPASSKSAAQRLPAATAAARGRGRRRRECVRRRSRARPARPRAR